MRVTWPLFQQTYNTDAFVAQLELELLDPKAYGARVCPVREVRVG